MNKSWRLETALRLTSLSSHAKIFIATAADMVVLGLSAILAFSLVHSPDSTGLATLTLLGPPLVVVCLYAVGAYKAVTRFIGIEFVERGAVAIVVAICAINGACALAGMERASWNLTILFGLIGLCFLLLSRLMAKRFLRPVLRTKGVINVLIYGAGDAGTQLASALAINCQYRPVAFVDDRQEMHGRTLLGLPVYSPAKLQELRSRNLFDQVLLAIPSVCRARRREILERLEALAVKVLVMPGMEDLASGRKQVDELREVQIEDLLERDTVTPVENLMNLFIRDKVVMITGAGGSIGSELCRQVLRQGARKLVMFELSEYALYRIDRELREDLDAGDCEIIPVLGSVQDRDVLRETMRQHAVETVYHAAAYKHVPLLESNIVTGVQNNVFGTLNTAQVALDCGVRNFVLVSTDKAVRPTNVMGASKRVCELIIQSLAEQHPGVRMSMVRFGNVLASSGSVVPVFREQIQRGGPVTVTHPDVTRYFMTIPEAAQLVIQAGAMGTNGQVFVLEMGKPVRIHEMAERMIHLSGLTVVNPSTGQGDIEIAYTGLRPGEKLYEELLIGDNPERTSHPRIFKATEAMLQWSELKQVLDRLERALAARAEGEIIEVLMLLVTGFVRNAISVIPQEMETLPLPELGIPKPRVEKPNVAADKPFFMAEPEPAKALVH